MEQEFKRTLPSRGIHESSTMDENSTILTKHSKELFHGKTTREVPQWMKIQ
jgi:hypothetical protein